MDTIKVNPYHISEFPHGITVDGTELVTRSGATFVVAASDSLHPGRADYVCDGVDDQVTIQAAIDALPSGGGKVVLMEGNYAVNRKSDSNYYAIGIPSNVEFEMLKGAVITLNANQNCTVLSNKNISEGNTGIYIHGGKIDGNKANQQDYTPPSEDLPDKTGHGIQLRKCTNSRVDGVSIIDTRYHSIMVWNYANRNTIQNCHIENSGLAGTSYTTVSGICVFYYSDNNLISNNRILRSDDAGDRPVNNRGIYLAIQSSKNIFENNFVSNWRVGVNIHRDGCNYNKINYNVFDISHSGVYMEGTDPCYYNAFIGNTIIVSSAAGEGFSMFGCDYASIISNTIQGDGEFTRGIANNGCDHMLISSNNINSLFWAISLLSSASNTSIIGNSGIGRLNIDATCTLSKVFDNMLPQMVVHSGATGTHRNNIGFITESSGTATLANGTTSIPVAHGLAVTPAAGDIVVTPIEAWGNMTTFYIDTYTATHFTIHSPIDPGQDVDFAWKAIVL